MDNEKIGNFLAEQRDDAQDDLQHYLERKLWHELTDTLIDFYGEDESAGQRIPMFDNFVKAFADKINQLKLVKLGLSAATQYKGTQKSALYLFDQANEVPNR
jgi:26S proteasome regulatory subunit N9